MRKHVLLFNQDQKLHLPPDNSNSSWLFITLSGCLLTSFYDVNSDCPVWEKLIKSGQLKKRDRYTGSNAKCPEKIFKSGCCKSSFVRTCTYTWKHYFCKAMSLAVLRILWPRKARHCSDSPRITVAIILLMSCLQESQFAVRSAGHVFLAYSHKWATLTQRWETVCSGRGLLGFTQFIV